MMRRTRTGRVVGWSMFYDFISFKLTSLNGW